MMIFPVPMLFTLPGVADGRKIKPFCGMFTRKSYNTAVTVPDGLSACNELTGFEQIVLEFSIGILWCSLLLLQQDSVWPSG
jgi:hypothetical protein